MAVDLISEEIARFIGLFHLEIEGSRLRLEYEAFAVKRDEAARTPEKVPDLVVNAPYSLKGFDPGLVYVSPPPTMDSAGFVPAVVLHEVNIAFDPLPTFPEREGEDPLSAGGWGYSWLPFVPLPNAILVSIQQSAELWDNDLVLSTGETTFIDPGQFVAQFLQVIDQAKGLSALGAEGTAMPLVPQVSDALAFAARIANFSPEDGPGETQLALRGEEATGNYVNGAQIAGTAIEGRDPAEPSDDGAGMEAAPAGISEAGTATGTQTVDAGLLPDFIDLLPEYLAAKRGEDEAEPGKDALETRPDGVTEAPVTGFEVDAGHKVVTGANIATNETSIVQVWVDAPVIAVAGDSVRLDVVSQVNVMAGPVAALDGTAPQPSTMLNVVSLVSESSVDPEAAPVPVASGQLPQNWSVVHVKGDLIAVNWVKQHIFVTDFDRAEITITAAATYISTGENIVSNAVRLVELGFHYDLILVGGSMITLNVIDQINVLMDVDVVGGATTKLVNHHSGDNLQYNRAELKQTGRDELTEMKDSFRKALDDLADGAKSISRDVAQDARFAGKSTLKVLSIEGDFVRANVVEQHNFLGDSDQIQLMLDEFLARGEAVHLVTGSNAQLNAARIVEVGLDSEIMVGGEAYSDALIYQAQLIDPEAPPAGVGMVPLANEAIAFLADGMLADCADHKTTLVAPIAEHSASSDVLHGIIT
ncbi:MAG: hypothetical protein ACK4HF_08390 [Paracoccaceae bacterium]